MKKYIVLIVALTLSGCSVPIVPGITGKWMLDSIEEGMSMTFRSGRKLYGSF